MKAMVHPYKRDELIRTDAFRGPIASAFKLHLEDLLGFYDAEQGLGMDDVCLRTDGLSPQYRASTSSSQSSSSVLPEFGCLILSPANAWKRDPASFQLDSNILSTLFGYHRSSAGAAGHHSSLAEVLLGMRQRDTGLTRYPIRNRQRVITYAATVALHSQPDFRFHAALRSHLKTQYPLPTFLSDLNSSSSYYQPEVELEEQEVFHIFFPSRSYTTELLPVAATLLALFFYVYYSCRKIELIHSKLGVALAALITATCSILMSLGMSGLSLNMDTKLCVVPYLVAFISLENVMVVTRSVSATPSHLDVRIRVARGLAKEGWGITKTLFAEITCLTVGFFIGILDASIQEFCLLAVMGLLSDFFLQVFFFATVLAVDMTQVGLRDAARKQRRSHNSRHMDFREKASIVANCASSPPTNGDALKMRRRQQLFQHPISGPGWISSSTRTSVEGHREETSNVLAPQVK